LPESPAKSNQHWLSRPATLTHGFGLVTPGYYTLGILEEGITAMVSVAKLAENAFY